MGTTCSLCLLLAAACCPSCLWAWGLFVVDFANSFFACAFELLAKFKIVYWIIVSNSDNGRTWSKPNDYVRTNHNSFSAMHQSNSTTWLNWIVVGWLCLINETALNWLRIHSYIHCLVCVQLYKSVAHSHTTQRKLEPFWSLGALLCPLHAKCFSRANTIALYVSPRMLAYLSRTGRTVRQRYTVQCIIYVDCTALHRTIHGECVQ